MLIKQLDLAIEAERDIERKLDAYDNIKTENKDIVIDYVQRQTTYDKYLYNLLKKSNQDSINLKLQILNLLLEKNLISMSIIESRTKTYGKNY